MPKSKPNEWFGFDPMTEFGAYRDAMRQLFNEGWDIPRDLWPSAIASVMVPIDIMDMGQDIVVRANMPGVKADTLSITLSGDTLTIKGTVSEELEYKDATYLRRERRASTYSRSVTIPAQVDADRSHAELRDGVLVLTLPKSESVRPKTIKVNYGA